MFTGIVQGVATVSALSDKAGLRSLTLEFPDGFTRELAIGASVSVDGVCLTVTDLKEGGRASFDVVLQSLSLTTLDTLRVGSRINVERSAHEGAEVGGHPLSGHVDCTASLVRIRRPPNNCVLRLALSAPWMRYVFEKGYIAINGASLTVAKAQRERDGSGWIEVWLIPETLRMTTFAEKDVGAPLNIEIDRHTQVVVDTVREAVSEQLGSLRPVLEALLRKHGIELEDLSHSNLLRDTTLRERVPSTSILDGGKATMATKRSKTSNKKSKPKDDPAGPHDDPAGPHDDPAGPHDDPAGPHGKKPSKKKKAKQPKKKGKSKRTKTPKKKK
jgi:riboflavin synthase